MSSNVRTAASNDGSLILSSYSPCVFIKLRYALERVKIWFPFYPFFSGCCSHFRDARTRSNNVLYY
jgi:hypothetical protein